MFIFLKGHVSVIISYSPWRDVNARFTMVYPCNLNLIKNEGDTVVFSESEKVFFLSIASYKQGMRKAHVYLRREPTIDN